MLEQFFSLFSQGLAVDLGTANTLVLVLGKGIVVREPSVVAINRKTQDLLAVGVEAKRMLGKTPGDIIALSPLSGGVISDFDITRKMLAYFVGKVSPPSPFRLPRSRLRIVLGIPSGVTPVERRAVLDAALSVGARRAFLVEEPMAAAIGSNLPVGEPQGLMIVDIGGGTCEIAVISLGGIVVNKSLKVAGNAMDQEIINYAKSQHNLLLGEGTAEELKISVGSAFPFEGEEEALGVMRGRDLSSGLPRLVEIPAAEIREALKSPVRSIVEAIKDTLEETPPELVSDVLKNGIAMAGGSSQLLGLDRLVTQETGMPVRVAKDPMTCVVKGCALALERPDLLARVQVK